MSGSSSHFIDGKWIDGEGPSFTSTNPATGATNWQGHAATTRQVDLAVASARSAATTWSDLSFEQRTKVLQRVVEQYAKRKSDLSNAISRETGKPRWESLAEAELMATKVSISIESHQSRVCANSMSTGGVTSATRYKPHGVVAVLGPFNMPGHLPNGHIVPAALAGNTVVFKPSEQTPLVGQVMAEAWTDAGISPGVFNLVQGAAQTGTDLTQHKDIDGVLFTGSAAVGIALRRALADRPGTILALEMGGNNPLVVHGCADHEAAAYLTVQSAFVTAGQRCSCARRLIVTEGRDGDVFVDVLLNAIGRIRIGFPSDDPEPFMGPVISPRAADRLLDVQKNLVAQGGRPLSEMRRSERSSALLSPGLIDVTDVRNRADDELFGPILQLIRVPDFDAAIREANNTRYGLTAGLLSDPKGLYERFHRDVRAGVIMWNRHTTGSSSKLPFGGVGLSGNHRPSAYFAADYCSYPVSSTEAERAVLPEKFPPGLSS